MHWRQMMDEREYVAAWDLTEDRTAEIIDVRPVRLTGSPGMKPTTKPVITFRNTEKKLVVNATIGRTIATLYGQDTDGWIGKKITLYASTTRSTNGENVECVRVRDSIPHDTRRGAQHRDQINPDEKAKP